MDDNIPHSYYYIYTLSDNGKVFYVGISNNIENRYKFHCSCSDTATFRYIFKMLSNDNLPGLEIINIASNKYIAMAIETSLIYYFVSIGNKLCNSEGNPKTNQFNFPITTPKPIKRKKKHYYKPIIEAAKFRHQKRTKYNEQNRLYYLGNAASISK